MIEIILWAGALLVMGCVGFVVYCVGWNSGWVRGVSLPLFPPVPRAPTTEELMVDPDVQEWMRSRISQGIKESLPYADPDYHKRLLDARKDGYRKGYGTGETIGYDKGWAACLEEMAESGKEEP